MKQILNTMTLAALAGLASFAAFAGPALASQQVLSETITDERSLVVHFGDLDPAQPADAVELLARMKLAARNACIRNDEGRQIFLTDDRKACIAASYSDAIAGINAKRNIDLEATAARYEPRRNLSAAR